MNNREEVREFLVSRAARARPDRRRLGGVLDALARALQLDDTERAHLLDLARAPDGIPTSGRPRRRSAGKAASRPSLQWALESIRDAVAFVRDPHQNLLAGMCVGITRTEAGRHRHPHDRRHREPQQSEGIPCRSPVAP